MKIYLKAAMIAASMACIGTVPSVAQDLSYITAPHALSPEDDAQLRQVISRLNHALDAADYDLYGSFFADDGVFVSGFGNAVGPEQVAAALEQVSPFITNKRHIAGNLVISGSGEDAVVTSYLIVFERETGLEYVGSAINVDTMKKIDGKWLVMRHDSALDPATQRYIEAQMNKQ